MGIANRLIAWSLAVFCSTALAAAPASTPAPPAGPTAAPAAPAPAGGHAIEKADLEAWLDGFLPYALETGDVGGAVVSVVKDGEIVLAKGYGYSDVDKKTPVDPQTTLFRPGSVSKLVTWTAVMQLVEQGKVNLDHDVNEYLPFKIPARSDGPITLRNIMTHTAGFEEQIKELIVADPKLLVSLGTYVERSTPVRIFKAGSTPAYSNYATAVAGFIVEHVSGQSFDDYLDAHIFAPLGMKHASFRQPLPTALAPDMSQGYGRASEPAKPYEIVVAAPAGSLAASGTDMARFMMAHLNGGEYQGGRILSPETAKMMHETPTPMVPPLNRMMLGFYEQNYNGHRVISHGGDTEFFHSYLHLLLDDHVGVFISVNSLGKDGAAGAIREALFEQFMGRYFPAVPDARTVDVATATAHAATIAGYYDNSRRADTDFMSVVNLIGAAKVEPGKDGTVNLTMFKGLNSAPRYYHEVAPFEWRDPTSRWRMAALVVDGKVARFTVDEVSPFMVFEPTPWWRSPAWLLPAVAIAVSACGLTALLWPVAAIVRRRNRLSLGLTGRSAIGRVYSRIAALVLTVVTVSWVAFILAGLSKISVLSRSMDPLLFVLHALSLVAYIGGAIVLVWAAYVTWTANRPWMTRIWSTVLALSGLTLLWMAWVYHLMSFRTTY